MTMEVGPPSRVARVTAVSPDHRRLWLEMSDGLTATVDSADHLEFQPGTILMVREEDNFIEVAPEEVWPTSAPDDQTGPGIWVGVVHLKDLSTTIVDVGGRWLRVPTSETVDYEVGNTVEGTAAGVTSVLDQKSISLFESRAVDDAAVASFRHEPDGNLSLEDFAGLPQVAARARELIELPLLQRERLDVIGAQAVRGVLFTGPPGTGKTMLARIIASTAGIAFYAVSGPTIMSRWYGQSEELLRRIFSDAAERSPSIIFFDEIDSVAGQRTDDAHEASKRVVAQLLTLMDGLDAGNAVTVIAATNRPQDVDLALRRPGRFDWQIDFPLPDQVGREAILARQNADLVTDEFLPHAWLAAQTDGWSPADLAAVWKEAAILAVADDRSAIMLEDYLGGHERVKAQRSRVMTTVAPRA